MVSDDLTQLAATWNENATGCADGKRRKDDNHTAISIGNMNRMDLNAEMTLFQSKDASRHPLLPFS
jgi:hypothetical protein